MKDTYDLGLESLRAALRDFLKTNADKKDGQQRRITEELVTIATAVICSISRTDYVELREEEMYDDGKGKLCSKVNAKLSFSVSFADEVAEATCSGNIKLKNDAAVKVEDTEQMKLNLD